jgi:diguanylate cyclase (GGDEF)-like protein
VHRSPLGEVTGLVTIARDVTDLKKNEQRIRQEHDRLILAASVGGLGIWDYDLRRDALTCDAQWYRIMGRDPNRPISSIAEFREFIHPDDVDRATEVDETAARLVADKEDYSIVFRIVRPDGEIRWVRSAASVMEDMAGIPSRAVGFVVDITETRLAEATLERQALEDSLTSIANRRRFDQEFERACLQASRTGEPLALAIVDVDFFKNYNDHYGHAEGDAALKSVARILSSATRRPYDLAARYGGEEFMLLMPATQHPETVLDGINAELASLRLPHATSPIGPYLTVSCGCVVAAQPGSISPADILAESDRALYRAKQGGRNRFVVVQL